MRGKSAYLFLSIIILLSIVGLASTLIMNPSHIFRYIIVSAIIIGIIYLLAQKFFATNRGSEHRAFLKAARSSKKRLKKKESYMKTSGRSVKKIRREATHLTVIEGKKGKRKSRAFH